VYEKETIRMIKKHYKKGTAIMHAGTFFGDMLPAFRDFDLVYAFEPNPESNKAAHLTMLLNGLNNIVLYPFALASQNETRRFQIVNGRGGRSSLASNEYDANKLHEITQVQTMKLEASEKVSVIHLDLEGAEMNVLKGAKELIDRDHPILILETYDINVLDKMGYKLIDTCCANGVFKYCPGKV
jgi:FkbM family methyltransferase